MKRDCAKPRSAPATVLSVSIVAISLSPRIERNLALRVAGSRRHEDPAPPEGHVVLCRDFVDAADAEVGPPLGPRLEHVEKRQAASSAEPESFAAGRVEQQKQVQRRWRVLLLVDSQIQPVSAVLLSKAVVGRGIWSIPGDPVQVAFQRFPVERLPLRIGFEKRLDLRWPSRESSLKSQ